MNNYNHQTIIHKEKKYHDETLQILVYDLKMIFF